MFARERAGPGCQQPSQLARLFVVARPLERLPASLPFRFVVAIGVRHPSGPQRLECALRPFAAVHSSRAEEHHRVLDLLLAKAAQGLQVLGENANRSTVGTLEELREEVGDWLM